MFTFFTLGINDPQGFKQDAQLSYGYYKSIYNHCDIMGLQSYRIR